MKCYYCNNNIPDGSAFCPFCGNRFQLCPGCGSTITDGDIFCSECGASLSDEIWGMPPKTEKKNRSTPTISRLNSRKKKLVIAAGAAAITLAVVLVIILIVAGNNGYKKTMARYYRAIETQNYKLLYDVYADYWQREYVKFTGSENYLKEEFEDDVEDELYDLHCGDQVKIRHKIYKVRKLPKDLRNELIDDIYDSIGVAELFGHERKNIYRSIKDAAIVYVSYNVIGNGGYDSFDYRYLLIKENGKWRMVRGLHLNDYDPDY